MPDPSLSDALKEAYASAPVVDVIYHTLEFWHAAFSVPIRVVRDYEPLEARLEATAARDASTVVTFVDYPFDLIPPEQNAAATPQVTIAIDNVDQVILAQIDQAVVSSTPITVIYRIFISGRTDIGPENSPPLELTILTLSATPLRITATAGFPNLLAKKFPNGEYTIDRFPALAS